MGDEAICFWCKCSKKVWILKDVRSDLSMSKNRVHSRHDTLSCAFTPPVLSAVSELLWPLLEARPPPSLLLHPTCCITQIYPNRKKKVSPHRPVGRKDFSHGHWLSFGALLQASLQPVYSWKWLYVLIPPTSLKQTFPGICFLSWKEREQLLLHASGWGDWPICTRLKTPLGGAGAAVFVDWSAPGRSTHWCCWVEEMPPVDWPFPLCLLNWLAL